MTKLQRSSKLQSLKGDACSSKVQNLRDIESGASAAVKSTSAFAKGYCGQDGGQGREGGRRGLLK
jgi:hypothetical protein